MTNNKPKTLISLLLDPTGSEDHATLTAKKM